jgi:DNA-binding FadR family transcriptional regulator
MRTQAGEFDDMIDFRIALETGAAHLAAVRRDRSDLVTLQAAIAKLDQVDSGHAAFRLADSQFHRGLAKAARNARLEAAIESVRGELFSPHDLLPYVNPVDESRRDHRQIYDAVRDRDPGRAASASWPVPQPRSTTRSSGPTPRRATTRSRADRANPRRKLA